MAVTAGAMFKTVLGDAAENPDNIMAAHDNELDPISPDLALEGEYNGVLAMRQALEGQLSAMDPHRLELDDLDIENPDAAIAKLGRDLSEGEENIRKTATVENAADNALNREMELANKLSSGPTFTG